MKLLPDWIANMIEDVAEAEQPPAFTRSLAYCNKVMNERQLEWARVKVPHFESAERQAIRAKKLSARSRIAAGAKDGE